MKRRLKHYQIPAGGLWHFHEPRSDLWFHLPTYDQLVNKLIKLYQDNGWPIGLGFEQWIEDRLIEQHPGESEPDTPQLRRKRKLTWGDFSRGTQVLVSFLAGGSKVVAQEEAESRAAICVECPENVKFDKPCGGVCQRLVEAVKTVIGNRKTKHDDQLMACSICHCWLQAAVHVSLEDQCKGVTEEMKTQFASVERCWKRCP